MKSFKKASLLISFIASVNIGIEEIFHLNVLDRLLVNHSWISFLFNLSCLFSGMVLLLMCFEKEE